MNSDVKTWDRRTLLKGSLVLGATAAVTPLSAAMSAKPLQTAASTIQIDHIALGVQNLYEGASRLRSETGFGVTEGGWFRGLGIANRIMPTGADTYIEIESVIDSYELDRGNPLAQWYHRQLADGDCFIGWCCRVTSLDELHAIAKRLGSEVLVGPIRTKADDSAGIATRTPDTAACWAKGLPNFFYVPDVTYNAGHVPLPGANMPHGIAWLELGGTEKQMSEWLGIPASTLPLRFNGSTPGIHAVGINSDRGVVEIRRKPIVV